MPMILINLISTRFVPSLQSSILKREPFFDLYFYITMPLVPHYLAMNLFFPDLSVYYWTPPLTTQFLGNSELLPY